MFSPTYVYFGELSARSKLEVESSYQANIRDKRLKLLELQVKDSQEQKIEAEKLDRN